MIKGTICDIKAVLCSSGFYTNVNNKVGVPGCDKNRLSIEAWECIKNSDVFERRLSEEGPDFIFWAMRLSQVERN